MGKDIQVSEDGHAVSTTGLLSRSRSIDALTRRFTEAKVEDRNALRDELLQERLHLALCVPTTPVDALAMLVRAQEMAQVLWTEPLDEDTTQYCALETVCALTGIQKYLEEKAGVTIEALGLTEDGPRLN
jgi:hypothetical protein